MKNSEKPNEIIFSKAKNKEKEKSSCIIKIADDEEEQGNEGNNSQENLKENIVMDINLNLNKENSSEFFEILNADKKREKKIKNFCQNFSKLKLEMQNINLIDIEFNRFNSFLNNFLEKN